MTTIELVSMLDQIESELAELKQMEELEAQVRAIVAVKREKLAGMLKDFAELRRKSAAEWQEPAPILERKERPYGAPGAPRDLLAQSGAAPATEVASKGAAVMLKPEPSKAPSPQQVFQSLNRLVGGKVSTLKN